MKLTGQAGQVKDKERRLDPIEKEIRQKNLLLYLLWSDGRLES